MTVYAELIKNDKEGSGGAGVTELTKKWMSLHLWRYISYVGAWALSMGALMMDGRV